MEKFKEVTHNDVPRVLGEIYQMLLRQQERTFYPEPEGDKLMSIEEFRNYMQIKTGKRPARQTVYDYVAKRKIPFEKHGGKFLYFRKSAIDEWLDNGRQMMAKSNAL